MASTADSILQSIKKLLGIGSDYTAFDMDVIMSINSAFSTLEQLGIGPEGGFSIEDESSTWNEFIGTDARFNSIKTYVYMRSRLVFDPPTTSFAIGSFKDQIKEIEWRLNVTRESDKWSSPVDSDELSEVIDGGAP